MPFFPTGNVNIKNTIAPHCSLSFTTHRAVLLFRNRRHGHLIIIAFCNLSRKRENTIPGDQQIIRAIILQHNLFASVPAFRAEGERKGMPTTMEITGLTFDRSASAEATPTITQVTIPFSSYNTVTWNYDAGSKTYLRVNNGKNFMDAGTGEQLHATNVVVLWAQHKTASSDVVGSTTYEIVLTGSGRATVFRNGQRYDCTWEATADAPPVFKAADGTQVKLSPGNTWMQVIRTDINITMQ